MKIGLEQGLDQYLSTKVVLKRIMKISLKQILDHYLIEEVPLNQLINNLPKTSPKSPSKQRNDTQPHHANLLGDDDCWYTSSPCDDIMPKFRVVHAQGEGRTKVYNLLAITDLDEDSGDANWTWRAVSRRGSLTIREDGTNVTITWINGSDKNLIT
ncbi:hypothetical protein KIN20_023186 [Parelaphostrongylus tenuis]|uniref:Uncharacterized protein n=1 Tax=Parelaphostrongylus tenuis TaxID=148309 RepID=A0AAD5QX68_PARTN|nr:hypothetical protein KIN20_023186 [Parelaphostrongylus tenuis]